MKEKTWNREKLLELARRLEHVEKDTYTDDELVDIIHSFCGPLGKILDAASGGYCHGE